MVKMLTKQDIIARRAKTVDQILVSLRKEFKEVLNKGEDCSVDYMPIDGKRGIFSLSHYDLMDKTQCRADLADLKYIISTHSEITRVSCCPFSIPTFRDFHNGAMPSISVEVQHVM